MALNNILLSLIAEINSIGQPVIVGWDEAALWSSGALETLVDSRLLVPSSEAKSIECAICEHRCFSDVITQKNNSLTRAFIVCGDPEMQSQMGRIEIPLQRLQQWKFSIQQLVKIIANLLGIENKSGNTFGQNNIRIGMMKGSKGRRWISLNTNPLSLEINNQTIPLEEILFFENDHLTIDKGRIDEQLNRTSQNIGKVYIPSTDKREASKRKILVRNQNWKDEYLRLKQHNHNKSDVWCSKQIARMDIAQNKDAETIRRNMK